MQATPRDEAVRLAMEMSLAEEETRKQRVRELEEAEDEAMRLALEASLLLAKEESLKGESLKAQRQAEEEPVGDAEKASEEAVGEAEEVKEGPPLVSQRSQ